MNQQKSFVNIVLTVLAVVFAGVVGYFALVKKLPETAEQTNTSTQTSTQSNNQISQTSINENANWKTYSNTRYSYTVKYPTNWYVYTASSENDFTQRGPVEDNEFIGGDTIFSNYSDPSSYTLDNPAPEDLFSVNLMIYKITSNILYDQFILSKHFGYDKKESININGISAVQLTGVTTDHPSGTTVINTLVKIGDKMFVFNYSGKSIPSQMQNIANGIINSVTSK